MPSRCAATAGNGKTLILLDNNPSNANSCDLAAKYFSLAATTLWNGNLRSQNNTKSCFTSNISEDLVLSGNNTLCMHLF